LIVSSTPPAFPEPIEPTGVETTNIVRKSFIVNDIFKKLIELSKNKDFAMAVSFALSRTGNSTLDF